MHVADFVLRDSKLHKILRDVTRDADKRAEPPIQESYQPAIEIARRENIVDMKKGLLRIQ